MNYGVGKTGKRLRLGFIALGAVATSIRARERPGIILRMSARMITRTDRATFWPVLPPRHFGTIARAFPARATVSIGGNTCE